MITLVFSVCSFIYYILLVISGLSFSGFSLFWVFTGIVGILICFLAQKEKGSDKKSIIAKQLRIALVTLTLCSMVIFVGILVFILTPQITLDNVDHPYLIVLGGGIQKNGTVSSITDSRLRTSLKYLDTHPETQVIVSGGQASYMPFPESQAMALYLNTHGIDTYRIIEEIHSRDTIENLYFSCQIFFEKIGKDIPIALITSDFHLARSLLIAKQMGLTNVTGISSPTPNLQKPNYYMREILATVKLFIRMFFTDSKDSLMKL
jgi:uncharacterized SAM-binding protein YcdF (DUF218 family)